MLPDVPQAVLPDARGWCAARQQCPTSGRDVVCGCRVRRRGCRVRRRRARAAAPAVEVQRIWRGCRVRRRMWRMSRYRAPLHVDVANDVAWNVGGLHVSEEVD